MLADYLSKENIRCNVKSENWRDAIRQAAQPLIASNKISERYVERTIHKVEELGPYIVLTKGVAVAHARPKADVNEESMSLITLDPPVAFGHKTNDPVSIVFLLAATNDDGHISAVMNVAQKLCEVGILDKMISATSAEEIYQLAVEEAPSVL